MSSKKEDQNLEEQKKNAFPSEKEKKKKAITGKEYKSEDGREEAKKQEAENEGSEYIDQKPNRHGKNIEEDTRNEADYDKIRNK